MSVSFFNRIIKSYIWTVFAYGTSFLRQFILVPFFMRYVGEEQYSYWLVALAITGVLMTINHGYFQFVSNKVNMTYRSNKQLAIKEFRSAFRFSFLQLILLTFISLILSSAFLFSKISNISIDAIAQFRINLVFLFLIFSSLIFSMFSGLILKLYEPVKKENLLYRFNFIYNFIDLIVLIFSVWFFKDLLKIAITITIVRVILMFVFALDIKSKASDFYPWWKEGSIIKELKTFKKSLFLVFSNFIERFQYDGLVLFIPHFLGQKFVTLFWTTRTIGNSATGGVASIINPSLPEMQANFSNRNWEKVSNIIFINLSITSFVISLFFIVITPFIEKIFSVWTEQQLILDKVFYLYIVISSILFIFSYNFLAIIRAFNFTQRTFVIIILKVILLFVIPFFLLKNLESLGIALMISETIGLFLTIIFLLLIFPISLLVNLLKIIILTLIPSTAAIIFINLLLKGSGDLFLFLAVFIILILINFMINGRFLISNFLKNDDII